MGIGAALRKGWVVTRLTIRYLVSTRRGMVTLALAWLPLLLTGGLALARVPSFGILLFQQLMLPLFLQVALVFVTLVSTTALIREEIDDNTLPYLLTRPVSKPTLAVSKYAGYLVAGLAFLLPPVVVSYVVTEGYVGAGLGADVDVLEGFLAATALGVLAYGALFYFLSVVLRKPLMVGLLIGFVWESVVVALPGSIPKLSLTYYLRSVLGGMIAVGPYTGNPDYVSAAVAVTVLVVFSVAMLVLSALAFQSMEFLQKA